MKKVVNDSLALVVSLGAIAVGGASAMAAEGMASGVVFNDADKNGRLDAGEAGLPGVRVSNGRDVVATDSLGRYRLPIDDDEIIFVIKPRGWMTPVDGNNLPQFYYIHRPAGSPGPLEYAGVAPTGELPSSIDFPLRKRAEPDRFEVVVFGDPQSRDVAEVDYLAQDLIAELIGTDAAFGVSLGDIAFDNLSVYEPYNAAMSAIGISWYNVPGNHDENYDVTSDELADETWERVYGPPSYAFDCGPVHFVIVDDVMYDGHEKKGRYHCELTEKQLAFLANDLKFVPRDSLVVLMMHIPLEFMRNSAELFALLQDRTNLLVLTAHQHEQWHQFHGAADGWPGARPLHEIVHVTACGSWWAGAPDERGIPHATMSDGTPNGYSIITFDDGRCFVRFKAASKPAGEQMYIFAPSVAVEGRTASEEVVVNVWAGSERSTVEMKICDRGGWIPMTRDERPDPYFVQMKVLESGETPPPGRELPKPGTCRHIWVASLPADLVKGVYVIRVRTTDMFGQTYEARRVLRVD